MHRIFVAIDLSKELQKKVLTFQKSLSQKIFTSASGSDVRWLSGKNLHITLIPPWYENNPTEIIAKLKTIRGQFSAFELEFTKITYGPNPNSPRLIWASGQTPPVIIELQKNLQKILNISTENRPFLLHFTLARFRQEDFKNFPIKTLNEKISWHQNVSSIVLMQSHLSRTGADYEILEKIKL